MICHANASREFAPLNCAKAEIRWAMRTTWARKSWWFLVTALLTVLPAAAQLEVGDNWSMSLSGDVGYNYRGNLNQGTERLLL